jgi:hypothetical protein
MRESPGEPSKSIAKLGFGEPPKMGASNSPLLAQRPRGRRKVVGAAPKLPGRGSR